MRVLPFILAGILACAALALPGCAAYPDARVVPMQATFASPAEAARALHRAARSPDIVELRRVLGRGSAMLLESGDDAEDELARDRFLAGFAQAALVQMNGDDSASLLIGKPSRTFPIPLVMIAGRWHFETGSAADAIVARRIARNEEAAIDTLRGIAEAQRTYARDPGDASPLRLPSALGADDGDAEPRLPRRGYFFRVLREGKAHDDFALLAYPARHGASGTRTFFVSLDGVVYAKDLGARTTETARAIGEVHPDRTWIAVPAT